MRPFPSIAPSVRSMRAGAPLHRLTGRIAQAFLVLLLLLGGGGLSGRASAQVAVPTCSLASVSPASQTGTLNGTLNYNFDVTGSCASASGTISITYDSTNGATLTGATTFNGAAGAYPFSMQLGPNGGFVQMEIQCTAGCDSNNTLFYNGNVPVVHDLTLVKALTGNTDPDGSGTVTPGDVLTYTVTATNTGNVPIANLPVSDPLTSPNSTTCANVAIGQACVLTGTYAVTAADARNGQISNVATSQVQVRCDGTCYRPVTASLNTRVYPPPMMTVSKSLTHTSDLDRSGNISVGDILTYTVTATNSGASALHNVVVNDPLTTPNTTTCATVPAGGRCTLTGNYTVTTSDQSNGSIVNTGNAMASEIPAGVNSNPVTTYVRSNPAMKVTKSLTSNADGDHSGNVSQGDVLTYTVTATNTGDVALTNVQVQDPLTSPNSTTCASVAPGASCSLSGSYTVGAGDVESGRIDNTGTATADQFCIDSCESFSASLQTRVFPTRSMTVTKALVSNADGDHSGSVTPGDVLTYAVTATNTGNASLDNVQVSDPLTTPSSTSCESVDPGNTCVLTGTYTVTAADAKRGSIANTGSAQANGVPAQSASLNTPVVNNAALTIAKTVSANADGDHSGTITAGDVLTFTVTATNNGGSTLTNVNVTDALTSPNSKTCASLAVGASCVLTGKYTVSGADADSGYFFNTGTASAAEISSPVSTTIAVEVGTFANSVSITKTLTGNADGDHSGSVTAGDVLTYTVTATNDAGFARNNFQVSDPMISPNSTTCATVAANASCVLTGTYTVTAADASNGAIVNTGTVIWPNGDFPSSASATLRTPVSSGAALSVVKQLTSNADGDHSNSVTVGDVLTYTVTATNTGVVALSNVRVSDPLTTPNSTFCASVAVNSTCVLTGTYKVKATDASNGSINNTGSAQSSEITTPVTASLNTPVASAPSPQMTVVKRLASNADNDGSGSVTVGDVLTYTVTVTNSGIVALSNVQISDPLTTPNAKTCASVAVNATCVLTGTYTVTAGDADNGSISNTGSAQAFGFEIPLTSSITTPVANGPANHPAMTVVKQLTHNADNDHSGSVTVGDVLTFTVTATNTGNVALTNVHVTDPLTSPNTANCTSVSVNGTCTLTGTYTVTANDASVGSITNTGSATANEIPDAQQSTLVTPVATVTKTIEIEDGDNQSGPPGTVLNSLDVNVLDNGSPASGGTVNWAVTSGTATLSSATTTVVDGTSSNTVTLGATPGTVTIIATRADVSSASVTFHETITAPVGPPVLSLVSGNNQTGPVDAHSVQAMVVHLDDGSGQPFSGQPVNWSVVSGSAALDASSSQTDANGNTQVGFTYGATPGAIVLRAAYGDSHVDFAATAVGYQITILGGNNQSATQGQPLPQDFEVVVSLPAGVTIASSSLHTLTTSSTTSLAGIPVQWQILAGGGSLSNGGNTTTDPSGHSSNHYTLGNSPGQNQVQVTVPGGASTTFTANATAPTQAAIAVVSGSSQTLTTNTPSAPLVVELTINGVPAPNVTIDWSGSNATLASATSVTDSNGRATNTASVVLPGAATVTASSVSPAAGPVTFSLNGGIGHLNGLTPQQAAVADALDNACAALAASSSLTPGQQDLLNQCQALAFSAGADPSQARNALNELFANIGFLQANAALLISTSQFDNIKARIAALRSGTGGTHFGGLAFQTPDGMVPVGSLTDSALGFADSKSKDKQDKEVGSDFDRWGFFASGTFGWGSSDPRQVTPGFGFHTNGLTAGVDYRYNDHLIFGVAGGYAKYSSDVHAAGGGVDSTGWSLSAYSTLFKQDSWYVDGVLTWGSNNYDITRRIIYTLTTNTGSTSVDQTATGHSGGSTFAGAFTFGRDFNKGAWSFGPYFRGTYTRVSFDDFHETLDPGNGSGIGLEVKTGDVTSVASVLGAKVNYASSQSWGVLMPHAELEWNHEFRSSPDSVTARFLNDPTNTSITVNGDPQDDDYFRLGLGMSFVWPKGRSGFIYYEKILGRSGITQDNLALGIRIEF